MMINYVVTSTCAEALDIMPKNSFARAFEVNTNNSYLRPSEPREAAR